MYLNKFKSCRVRWWRKNKPLCRPAVVVFVLRAEGSHLVSIKVLETGSERVHFKICSCGKIKWTPRWFCGCSQIYIIRLWERLYAAELWSKICCLEMGGDTWQSLLHNEKQHENTSRDALYSLHSHWIQDTMNQSCPTSFIQLFLTLVNKMATKAATVFTPEFPQVVI